MIKGKNFFYRINPCEVLAEAIFAENKELWFMQFFNDLKNDNPETAKLQLSANIIREAHGFRAKRAVAGKASAEQKANKKQHMLKDVITNDQQTSTSSSSSTKPIKPIAKNFVPPSIEEVTTYTKERGNKVDPEKWFNFYESKGWMVGKNKMQDWKAAVRTWEKSKKEEAECTTPHWF